MWRQAQAKNSVKQYCQAIEIGGHVGALMPQRGSKLIKARTIDDVSRCSTALLGKTTCPYLFRDGGRSNASFANRLHEPDLPPSQTSLSWIRCRCKSAAVSFYPTSEACVPRRATVLVHFAALRLRSFGKVCQCCMVLLRGLWRRWAELG